MEEFEEIETIVHEIKTQTGLIVLLILFNFFTVIFNIIAFYLLFSNKG